MLFWLSCTRQTFSRSRPARKYSRNSQTSYKIQPRRHRVLEIYTTASDCFIDEENVIHVPDAGTLKVYGIAEYIEDPASHVDEIHETARKADELRKELNKAIDKYKALNVDGFKTLNRVYN